jgi:hypothetical protein
VYHIFGARSSKSSKLVVWWGGGNRPSYDLPTSWFEHTQNLCRLTPGTQSGLDNFYEGQGYVSLNDPPSVDLPIETAITKTIKIRVNKFADKRQMYRRLEDDSFRRDLLNHCLKTLIQAYQQYIDRQTPSINPNTEQAFPQEYLTLWAPNLYQFKWYLIRENEEYCVLGYSIQGI